MPRSRYRSRPDLFRGRTTLITGGGTGLGRAMALRLSGLGAKVALVGQRPEPLEATASEIRAAGGEAAAVPGDIREPQAVRAAFDAAEQALGPVDQLVNYAAGNFLCASEDLTPNAFDSVMRIVLYGSFHCPTELGRRLIARGAPGQVLSIVTTYTQTGSPFVLPSSPSVDKKEPTPGGGVPTSMLQSSPLSSCAMRIAFLVTTSFAFSNRTAALAS